MNPLATAAGLALALALLAPLAAAAEAHVTLEQQGTAWNGASRLDLAPEDAGREVAVWIPANARIHHVHADGNETTWRAGGADTLLVRAPTQTTTITVGFDIPDRRPYLAQYVAPPGVGRVTLTVHPENGGIAQSPDVAFHDGLASTAVAPGDRIAVRISEPGRVGELPLLLTVGGLSLLVLLGTLAYHHARPPLGGREPTRPLDHLSELQARLLPPALLFALLNLLYFTSGLRTLDAFPYLGPTWGTDASIAARAFDALAERLVPPDVTLVVLRPADAVLAQVGMCLFLALATILPLLVYEIGAFIAPGLRPNERHVAARTLPLITGLFLLGALAGYLIAAPLMIRTLYSYAPGIGAAPLLAVGELVSFSLLVILTLAIAFELPIVMYALARLRLVQARTFGRYVRHATLAIVILAGLITPDPSVVSQLLLAVPIVALYVTGIGAAAMAERRATA